MIYIKKSFVIFFKYPNKKLMIISGITINKVINIQAQKYIAKAQKYITEVLKFEFSNIFLFIISIQDDVHNFLTTLFISSKSTKSNKLVWVFFLLQIRQLDNIFLSIHLECK